MKTKLHHFGLSVPDLEAAVNWYTKTLDFRLLYRYEMPEPQARVAFLTRGDFRVELFAVANATPLPDSRQSVAADLQVNGLKHVAFGVVDLDAAKADLEARGVTFVGEPMTVPNSGGERFVFFRDIAGNLIELYQPATEPDAEQAQL